KSLNTFSQIERVFRLFYFFNKRNEFNITNIAAPVSLRTANQSVSNPGNTNTKAINLIIIAKYRFCCKVESIV
ncbi:hypothetical protein, partial [Staphylococcus epidermidis]|uniref:hypothetical protein n=3 Tax=Staphylococcus TaxID=1279 RepID=UPI001E28781F